MQVRSVLLERQVDATQELRRSVGDWLRAQRERCGYSQTELAKALGLEYYTFISQIENGRGRIPSNRYAEWADALKMSRRDFAMRMMQHYDAFTYDLIFGEGGSGN